MTLKPGPEVDALVATKVMELKGVGYYGPSKPSGRHIDYTLCATREEALALYVKHWTIRQRGLQCGADMTVEDIRPLYWKDGWGPHVYGEYSEDIAAAFEVVEKMWPLMRDQGKDIVLTRARYVSGEVWIVADGEDEYGGEVLAQAAILPHAICLASLRAVGEDV